MIDKDDRRFLTKEFSRIDGWCLDEAAWLTAALLQGQLDEGRAGPLFEIGVYKGKYFSLLTHHARKAGVTAFGFDTFQWVPEEEAMLNLHRACGQDAPFRMIAGDSSELTPEGLAAVLGAPAAFASVDGSHDAGPVEHDLRLADAATAPWGLVALDDFYNPMAIGVTEGLFRFVARGEGDLAPVAFCKNKLLLAREAHAEHYAAQFLRFCETTTELKSVRAWLEMHERQGEHWVRQRFLDRLVWVFA